jgi:hypothetical protein
MPPINFTQNYTNLVILVMHSMLFVRHQYCYDFSARHCALDLHIKFFLSATGMPIILGFEELIYLRA